MELPSFLDEDIIYSIGFWTLTIGVWIAFLIGFKGADTGLFGISDSPLNIPLFTKILLLVLTPVIAYIMSGRFFRN